MTKQEREDALKRCEAATKAPWSAENSHDGWWRVKGEHVIFSDALKDDAIFGAAARTDLPSALAGLQALKDALMPFAMAEDDDLAAAWVRPCCRKAAKLLRSMGELE